MREESFGVAPYLVAMVMVAGASGGPGATVPFLVAEDWCSEGAGVITPPLRMVGGAVWEPCSKRETATLTCAQVAAHPSQSSFERLVVFSHTHRP